MHREKVDGLLAGNMSTEEVNTYKSACSIH